VPHEEISQSIGRHFFTLQTCVWLTGGHAAPPFPARCKTCLLRFCVPLLQVLLHSSHLDLGGYGIQRIYDGGWDPTDI
jgi:hypothetical protein